MAHKDAYACKECGRIHTLAEIVANPACRDCGHDEYSYSPDHPTPICDFCSTPAVTHTYPCRDFRRDLGSLGGPAYGSAGWWAACRECYELIRDGNRQALAERSTETWFKANPNDNLPREFVVNHVRELHDQFWSNREGPALEHVEAE